MVIQPLLDDDYQRTVSEIDGLNRLLSPVLGRLTPLAHGTPLFDDLLSLGELAGEGHLLASLPFFRRLRPFLNGHAQEVLHDTLDNAANQRARVVPKRVRDLYDILLNLRNYFAHRALSSQDIGPHEGHIGSLVLARQFVEMARYSRKVPPTLQGVPVVEGAPLCLAELRDLDASMAGYFAPGINHSLLEPFVAPRRREGSLQVPLSHAQKLLRPLALTYCEYVRLAHLAWEGAQRRDAWCAWQARLDEAILIAIGAHFRWLRNQIEALAGSVEDCWYVELTLVFG